MLVIMLKIKESLKFLLNVNYYNNLLKLFPGPCNSSKMPLSEYVVTFTMKT